MHEPANDRDYYSLAYAHFVMLLVQAVQELSGQVDATKAENATLLISRTADHARLLTLQAQMARRLGDTAPTTQAHR